MGPKCESKPKASFPCNVCGKIISSRENLYRHKKIHLKVKPLKCSYCEKGFCRKDDLKAHTTIHTGELPYKCEICDKAFNTKSHYKRHLNVHTGVKPYSCTTCHQKFTFPQNLKNHQITHMSDSEKTFKCLKCDKCFAAAIRLKRHMVSHSDERPFACILCPSKFKLAKCLKEHTVFVHNQENTVKACLCELCGKRFSKPQHVDRHKRFCHYSIDPFTCTDCDETLSSEEALKSHKCNPATETESSVPNDATSSEITCNHMESENRSLGKFTEDIENSISGKSTDDTENNSLEKSTEVPVYVKLASNLMELSEQECAKVQECEEDTDSSKYNLLVEAIQEHQKNATVETINEHQIEKNATVETIHEHQIEKNATVVETLHEHQIEKNATVETIHEHQIEKNATVETIHEHQIEKNATVTGLHESFGISQSTGPTGTPNNIDQLGNISNELPYDDDRQAEPEFAVTDDDNDYTSGYTPVEPILPKDESNKFSDLNLKPTESFANIRLQCILVTIQETATTVVIECNKTSTGLVFFDRDLIPKDGNDTGYEHGQTLSMLKSLQDVEIDLTLSKLQLDQDQALDQTQNTYKLLNSQRKQAKTSGESEIKHSSNVTNVNVNRSTPSQPNDAGTVVEVINDGNSSSFVKKMINDGNSSSFEKNEKKNDGKYSSFEKNEKKVNDGNSSSFEKNEKKNDGKYSSFEKKMKINDGNSSSFEKNEKKINDGNASLPELQYYGDSTGNLEMDADDSGDVEDVKTPELTETTVKVEAEVENEDVIMAPVTVDEEAEYFLPSNRDCHICRKTFKTVYSLKRHIMKKHDTKANARYACSRPKCDRVFVDYRDLVEHKLTHRKNVRRHVCEVCGVKYQKAKSMQRHIKLFHTGTPAFTCRACLKPFVYKESLDRHTLTHSEIELKPNPCGKCDQRFETVNQLKRHTRDSHFEMKKYTCPICKKDCKSKQSYDTHYACHTKQFLCDHCGHECYSVSRLAKHKRAVHDKLNSHQCSICGKGFKSYSGYKVHMTIHTGEKKYVCDECGYRSNDFSNLTKHKRTHDKYKFGETVNI